MRDNVKGGALTEVTFYILLSLYTPKHGYAERYNVRQGTVNCGRGKRWKRLRIAYDL